MITRTILAAAALGLAAPALAQEERTVSMDDVPHAAMAAAQYAAGVDTFEAVGLDMDGGQATYELSTNTTDGKGIEIDVLADGTVIEIERSVEMGDVPQQVTALLNKHFPNMEPTAIEHSTRANFVTFYEFEGTIDGSEIDVEVREDGKQIVIQDDAAA